MKERLQHSVSNSERNMGVIYPANRTEMNRLIEHTYWNQNQC